MKDNFGSEYSKYWNISEDVIFLNHGSFGACPEEVLSYQRFVRAKLETEPMRFFIRESEIHIYIK